MTRLWRIIALAALGALTACSVVNPPYRPEVGPEASGLVIVRGEMIMPLERWGKFLAGGAKEEVRPMDYGRIEDERGTSVSGRAIGEGSADVLVFSPPRPGRYRIATLGYVQRRSTGAYPVDFAPPPEVLAGTPALTFDVRPGEVSVLSKAVIHYNDATLQTDFELTRWEVVADAAGERAAMATVLTALDAASPWRTVLERRMK